MAKLRILLADDHEVVRRGIRSLLEARTEWEICDEATTGLEAVEKARRLKPDIVVMDIGMPLLNGLEATRQICSASPGTEVLALTMHDSEQLMREVLEAGARGYVFKSDAARNLVAAIEALARHKPFLSSKVSDMVVEEYLDRRGQPQHEPVLTGRERQVLQLLAEGKSNKEIARLLRISVKTAETHRGNIMRKLQFRSVSDLVHYAIRNGIVSA